MLFWYGLRRKGQVPFLKRWGAAILGLLVCGLIIAAEFALDGKILIGGEMIPKWVTYGLMLAGLGAMAVAEHKARKNP